MYEEFSIYYMVDHTGDGYDFEVVMLIDEDLDGGRYTLERGYPFETEQECEHAGFTAQQKWKDKFEDHIHSFVKDAEPSGAMTQP